VRIERSEARSAEEAVRSSWTDDDSVRIERSDASYIERVEEAVRFSVY
jgi:hypothetical protein